MAWQCFERDAREHPGAHLRLLGPLVKHKVADPQIILLLVCAIHQRPDDLASGPVGRKLSGTATSPTAGASPLLKWANRQYAHNRILASFVGFSNPCPSEY